MKLRNQQQPTSKASAFTLVVNNGSLEAAKPFAGSPAPLPENLARQRLGEIGFAITDMRNSIKLDNAALQVRQNLLEARAAEHMRLPDIDDVINGGAADKHQVPRTIEGVIAHLNILGKGRIKHLLGFAFTALTGGVIGVVEITLLTSTLELAFPEMAGHSGFNRPLMAMMFGTIAFTSHIALDKAPAKVKAFIDKIGLGLVATYAAASGVMLLLSTWQGVAPSSDTPDVSWDTEGLPPVNSLGSALNSLGGFAVGLAMMPTTILSLLAIHKLVNVGKKSLNAFATSHALASEAHELEAELKSISRELAELEAKEAHLSAIAAALAENAVRDFAELYAPAIARLEKLIRTQEANAGQDLRDFDLTTLKARLNDVVQSISVQRFRALIDNA